MTPSSYESFGQVRVLVDDLFRVRPAIYWIDFSICMVFAWSGLWLAFRTPWTAFSWKAIWLLLSSFAFFHGLIFVHEIEHNGRSGLAGFRWVWNAFCGLLFFLPDYTYRAHALHHRALAFSTSEDPEYLPLACQRPVEILAPFFIFPLVPFILAARFLVLGPASLIIGGRFRDWILRHASTLKMNPKFEWTAISAEDRRLAAVQDVTCVVWWMAFLAVCHWLLHRQAIVEWYLITYLIFTINHVRSLARHRYINAACGKVSYEDQILDSVTISGFSPLTWLLMPIGLRYHSVHHMFPRLPYHALAQAHRRLTAALPREHIYHKTLVPSLTEALANLFKSSLGFASSRQPHPHG
jgi:fatty acid desaturase